MSDKLTVVEALTAVMAEVQSVGKGQRNLEQGYNFRGIDAVVNAVGPMLRKHGVVVLPILEEANHRDVLTTRDKKSRESTVRVRYRFYGPAGDSVEAVVPGEAMDFGDKGVAKAMSVAYRIVLLQALCIPTDEPDPDSQTYERAEWTAERPPTDEQVERFDAIRGSIAVATTKEHFAAAWAAIVAAYKADELTTTQANTLRTELGKRKEGLPDVSTGDGDGGGAEPGPAGEGTGPDGEGVRERGPGRDGEAGGGGPGVQSRVRGRDGSGGPPQASGDDRNAPAAARGRRG